MDISDEQSQLYDRYFSTSYDARNDTSEEGIRKMAASYSREFKGHFPENLQAPILEIGCGLGAFLRACRDLGYEDVMGIDISREQVELCQSAGFKNTLRAEALKYLDTCERSFDLIVMSDVLEHVSPSEVVPTLIAVRERLAPGGKVILRVPNMSNPLNLRTRYVDFTHRCGFSAESLAQVLRMSGLTIIEVRGIFYPNNRWLARLVFDRLLWSAFRQIYRRTLHLKQEPVRGKNLLGVGIRTEVE